MLKPADLNLNLVIYQKQIANHIKSYAQKYFSCKIGSCKN